MQTVLLLYTNTRQPCSWKIKFFFFLTVLLASTTSYAQTFSGKVVDVGEEALEGANVIAVDEKNATLCYAITDEKGTYKLSVPEGIRPKQVTVRFMGYTAEDIPFEVFKDGMTIVMKAGKFQLKEVKVKASKIRSFGDTLSYSVAAFKQGQDRSIADVIKKMPGLEVNDNGTVLFQGHPINKFYIEGLDLMGNQYGIANNNISAQNIKSVQVLKNHQPVKSLRGISFSDQAALNLVLSDAAKDVWNGTADVGLGYGNTLLYDCRLMGMVFNKKRQALVDRKSVV